MDQISLTQDLAALLQVVLIDITLAGDNAIVVGMAVAGLPDRQKRPAILLGIIGATVIRIALGAIALELMTKVQYAGFRTVEVPVNHFHRAYGVSQFFRVGRLVKVVISLSKLWWWLRVKHGVGTPSRLPEPLPAGAPRPSYAKRVG